MMLSSLSLVLKLLLLLLGEHRCAVLLEPEIHVYVFEYEQWKFSFVVLQLLRDNFESGIHVQVFEYEQHHNGLSQ